MTLHLVPPLPVVVSVPDPKPATVTYINEQAERAAAMLRHPSSRSKVQR